MKNTPFTQKHIELGAKMAEFAGYNMPISYSGINDEHHTVRRAAGVFDVSHMGEFMLKGEGALNLIQRVTTNDASKLTAGKAQYSCLPNNKGGMVDDLLVYCIEENKVYMLVVNASNIEKDWNWIQHHNDKGVEMHNISDATCLLAVQGPNATKILQPLTEMDILNLKYYTFAKGEFAGVKNVLVSATGYTGAGGVEIYFEDKDGAADKIWNAIFEAGGPQGLKPIGLAARDTLRLEMGFCLYGNDIDDMTSPLEAGLGWITKLGKEDFTSKDIFQKQKEEGVKRKLVGFEMVDKGIPRHHYEICCKDGEAIGYVTSGTQSPSLNKAIGMGYVAIEHSAIDSPIYIKVRDKLLQAKVAKNAVCLMPLIHLETFIKAPPQVVFDTSRSIDLHQSSMTRYSEKAIAGVKSGLMNKGDTVTWQAKHLFRNRKLKVMMTELEAPAFFADEMLEGDFKTIRHEHFFKPVDDGTIMIDDFYFESPFGVMGKIINALFLTNYMKRLLLERNNEIKATTEDVTVKRMRP